MKMTQIKINTRFGSSTLIGIHKEIYIFRCDCGQSIYLAKADLQEQVAPACLRCEENEAAKSFENGEIVFVKYSSYREVLRQEAIVVGSIEIDKTVWLEVEFRGRKYKHLSSQLEKTGEKFYVDYIRFSRV